MALEEASKEAENSGEVTSGRTGEAVVGQGEAIPTAMRALVLMANFGQKRRWRRRGERRRLDLVAVSM